MKCAWQAYLHILPLWMRESVDNLGRESLQELRLRVDRPPELVLGNGSVYLERTVKPDDFKYCINAASKYSPWSSNTISKGYITAQGGHRIGICGDAAIIDGQLNTMNTVNSLCIRVARDFPGVAAKAASLTGSIVVIGRPGTGKTTLLRDLIRQKSNLGPGAVAVVDERREIFPMSDGSFCFSLGRRTDVISGVDKTVGVDMLIRTMNPRWIVMDEITAAEDSMALLYAGWCGVSIIASAHSENLEDFMTRPIYRPLIEKQFFMHCIVMQPDKSWTLERMNKCN